MTKDEALKMAIEWMSKTSTFIPHKGIEGEDLDVEGLRVFNACKEALEQPAQEPVGYLQEESPNGKGFFATYLPMKDMKNKPLYTHPHQWQGLTDDEVGDLITPYEYSVHPDLDGLTRAIEAKLKEKNYV